ncbi:uncharacterized protein B0H18DRAFT_966256 [Fomitopsis serialis]|uniref:uncharacterized protein n=1 Tax=Fomitopsis serialis TaxID=139415 RepID=UPI002007ED59|nr:uncharacterized protein B0H18DRAFT_966256 [Neoantrodia serialis]KAH9938255.1 hypothetical protein B0H18DRAFT_966256 [Neoantrodia serialis]
MKRSYDHTFANDRDHTFAPTAHSFKLRHPYAGAPQAACPTNPTYGSGSGYLDFRRPLINTSSGSNDDFQSNAATPKAVAPPRADSYFTIRPDPGTTGLGIHCDSIANHSARTVKQEEIPLDSLSELCSPVPGGLLELLTKPHVEPTRGNEACLSHTEAPNATIYDDPLDDVITFEDSLAYFPRSDTPVLHSLPSLLYPSSSGFNAGDFYSNGPLFYPSGSESSVESTLVNTSLFYPSSTEASVNNSPIKKAPFYASSSFDSVQDAHSASSGYAKDSLRTLLNFDSPLLGLGYDAGSDKKEEPVVGLYADINLRRVLTRHDAPRQLPTVDSEDITGFTEEAVQAIVGVITAAKQDEDMIVSPGLPPPTDAPAFVFDLPRIPVCPSSDGAACLCHILQASGAQESVPVAQLSFTASLDYAPYAFFPSSFTALQPSQRTPLLDRQPPAPAQQAPPYASPMFFNTADAPHPQTPVCNAHMGVELEELRRRAENYRRCNPGTDIDKLWLQSFAGRLSEDGVLMDEWRCYVKGCAQHNKRRDHILVHVGSHVEHRPFSCGRWYVLLRTFCACVRLTLRRCDSGMRFLRKNECKRHEASHDGAKPFECMICAPVQHRSFARQDLLRRHMRVTHGVTGESAVDRRKRMRTDVDDGEYRP